MPARGIGGRITYYPFFKENIIKTLRILLLTALIISSVAVIIKIFPIHLETIQPAQCDADLSSPAQESYNPTPINNGFKNYYIKIDVNPFPENAIILYKGKEVGLTKIWFGGHKVDWGIDTEHVQEFGEDYVVFGVGTVWAWAPGHWGWQNPENWQVIAPCP